MTQTHKPIQEIQAGANVRDIFLISSASLLQSRNGPYWRVELKDATGTLEAKIWSPQSAAYPDLPAGQFVEVLGKAGSYKDQVQLVVEKLRFLTPEEVQGLDRSAFMRVSDPAPEVLMAQMEALCRKELTHAPWRAFVLSVLKNSSVRERLLYAPAAKSIHHAYAGGLLEHLLSVSSLCLKLADHYPDIDRQTLFVGALFHDIGKMEEYTSGMNIDYTDEGRLMGHTTLGLLMLEPFLAKSRLEPGLKAHLRHLILSHHGETAYGAAREPATPEAFLLHFADNMDAKVAQCRALFDASAAKAQKSTADTAQRAAENGEIVPGAEMGAELGAGSGNEICAEPGNGETQASSQQEQSEGFLWTPWQSLLGRSLARPPHTPKPVEKKKPQRGHSHAQEPAQESPQHKDRPSQISLL